LTGIVEVGTERTALIEDTSQKKGYFLKEGDKFKNYLVETILDESIVLVKDNSKLTTDLGSKAYYDSSRQIIISRQADKQGMPEPVKVAKNADGKVASSNGNAEELSIIERMRERRRKELEQE